MESDKRLYSFDIYDTLITRKTATPNGIFALMQKKMMEASEYGSYPRMLVYNFYLLRIHSEMVARKTYAVGAFRDITLSCIYKCIGQIWELSDEQVQKLMALEIEMEMENTLPVQENINKVCSLIEEGKYVVLISNMYLEARVIRQILARINPVFKDMSIYVSGELGKTKNSWTLYNHVKEQERIQSSQWYHLGDDWNLDVLIPKKMGIHGEHFRPTELYKWEKELLDGRENNPQLQLMLGISKRVRGSSERSFSYQVGSGYSAEVLLPYVLWVIAESLKKGINHLFFVARDGYILKKMADIVIRAYDYPITTSYLYGSRRAWRLPSVTPGGLDLRELFRWSGLGQICTYQDFAENLGLTMEELKQFLPFIREKRKGLSRAVAKEILNILVAQENEIAALIYKKQQKQREAVIRYLDQEIGSMEKECAFVELIGSGYTQKCLADLIGGFYHEPVRTFFYRQDSCRLYERNTNYVFFPNRISMGNVIEVLCGAPHGQTNGYEYRDGSWKPVLGDDDGGKLENYGFSDYLCGIEDYVKEFVTYFPNEPLKLDDLSIIELYLNYMSESKDQQLYDFVADMPYSVTGKERKPVSFAPRLSGRDLRQIYLWHKGEDVRKYYMGFSLDFSLIRLTGKQRKKLEFYINHSEDKTVRWLREHVCQSKVCRHNYELIADRIVLYGAGKKGRMMYRQLTAGRQYHADIVLWVDKNYESCRAEGLDVWALENIRDVDYQQVIIAVASETMAEEIKASLVDSGVPYSKIVWINPDSRIK